MAKIKMKRQSTAVDMTAMCDVAFLLLTFFILTSKFRPKDPVDIVTPGSQAEKKVKEHNVMTITLDKTGKVFFGMDNPKTKEAALRLMMADNPSVKFTQGDIEKFLNTEAFGVPFSNLPQYLQSETVIEGKDQPGIPVDTLSGSIAGKSELAEWLRLTTDADSELREVTQEIKSVKGKDEGIGIILKGDGLAEYQNLKKILNLLQQMNMNKFQMVTALKAGSGSGEATKHE